MSSEIEDARKKLEKVISRTPRVGSGEHLNTMELLKAEADLYSAQRNGQQKEEEIRIEEERKRWERPMRRSDKAMLLTVFTGPIGGFFGVAAAEAIKVNEAAGFGIGFLGGIAIAIMASVKN